MCTLGVLGLLCETPAKRPPRERRKKERKKEWTLWWWKKKKREMLAPHPSGASPFGAHPSAPHPSSPHPSAPHPSAPHPSAPHPSAPHPSGPLVHVFPVPFVTFWSCPNVVFFVPFPFFFCPVAFFVPTQTSHVSLLTHRARVFTSHCGSMCLWCAFVPSTCHPWCHMFERALLLVVSSFSSSLISAFSLSQSTCSLSCTSTSTMSSPSQLSPFTYASTERPVHELRSCQKRKSSREMENERIRILLERQREQILAEFRTWDPEARISSRFCLNDGKLIILLQVMNKSDENNYQNKIGIFLNLISQVLMRWKNWLRVTSRRIFEKKIDRNSRHYFWTDGWNSGTTDWRLIPPYRDPGGFLSRNDKPSDIWNTHGMSGNVFVNPLGSVMPVRTVNEKFIRP